MQIQFPRRVQLGFRPFYGLTLRQLAYLVVSGVAAGGIVLFGPVTRGGLLVRVIIGLGFISIGVALAFFRKDGLTAEQWLVTQVKFLLRPQKRVWTRGGDDSPSRQSAEIRLDESATDAPAALGRDEAEVVRTRLLSPTVQSAVESQAAVIFIDMAMLLSFFSLAIYLVRGGFSELQGWLLLQLTR